MADRLDLHFLDESGFAPTLPITYTWARAKARARVPYEAGKKYFRVIRQLRDDPNDFVKAFLQIDSDYRALLLFTYQSYLWNEGVRRLLQLTFPREHLFPMPYQAGTLLHHTDASPDVLAWLKKLTFPLLAPNSTFTDPKVEWVTG